MIELETPADLAARAGCKLGVSDWLTIDQDMIDRFADVTGDRQWIHVDVARAKSEMPGGRTIAHGYLVLSLLPRLEKMTYRVTRRSRGLNYGLNRVRFIAPIASGARVRLHQTLKAVEALPGGFRFTFESTLEVEGLDKPGLVAETIAQLYD